MKKLISLLVVALFVMSTAAAFAVECQTSTASNESGWQKVYNDMKGWSWGKTSGSEKKEKAVEPAEAEKGTETAPKSCK